ncbi:MAG: hypothetical protein K2K97_08135, partial [Muribaculaceae bacterium]|nr:hypothetical protein [Muribaculaceae bacterium]
MEDYDNKYKAEQNLYATENQNEFPGVYSLEDDICLSETIPTQKEEMPDMEYTLPENDKEQDMPNSEYSLIDDSDDPEAWQGETVETRDTPLGLLWKIMSNPTEGCKALKRSKFSVERISGGLFYPIIIIAGLSNLTALFYDVESEGVELAINITFTVITFFFGYFTTLLMGGVLLCKEVRGVLHTYYGKEFVMYCVS